MCSFSHRLKALIATLIMSTLVTAHIVGQTVRVDSITLAGNKKTIAKTINFENPIKRGLHIAIDSLDATIDNSRLQLLSSGLFNAVETTITYNQDTTAAHLHYDFIENWYLFPVPILELADRNFNVWWQEFDRDLSRVIYGGRVAHYNLTGRRDKIKFVAHTGYQRKLELTYDLPNIIGDNWGLGVNLFFSDRKEIGYKTEYNKTLFFQAEDERVLLKRFRVGTKLIYRPTTFVDQVIRLEFHQNTVADTIAQHFNPDYFPDGGNRLRFFMAEYDIQQDKTDYSLYPSRGYKWRFNIKKEGLFIFDEVDNTFITLSGKYYQPLGEKVILTTQWEGRTNLSRTPLSFSNNTGLGWSDFLVTGYDLYVMDGPDYIITKNYLSFQLFDFQFSFFDFVPTQFRVLPLQAYLRANFDLAYVNEPTYIQTNDLNNRLIYGFGPAIDIIAYHNYLFAIEYGITQDLETGIYVKTSISF